MPFPKFVEYCPPEEAGTGDRSDFFRLLFELALGVRLKAPEGDAGETDAGPPRK